MHAESLKLDAEVETLLAEAGLPVSDLSSRGSLALLGVRENGRLVGVVGIEVYGKVGLLRSLAVRDARLNAGIGSRLVSAAESGSAERGIGALYLLTTTAAAFFARLGYQVVPRSDAPAAIAATSQFADLCPSSATFMRKALSPDGTRLRAASDDDRR